jgi:hypothetical protein
VSTDMDGCSLDGIALGRYPNTSWAVLHSVRESKIWSL